MTTFLRVLLFLFPCAGNRQRRGSFVILTAIGSIFLIGLTALVTDVGWLYYNKIKIQTAVNAGWKAGMDRAAELGGMPLSSSDQALVVSRAEEVTQMNWPNTLAVSVTFAPGGNSFRVSALPPVGLMFARVLSFNSANVAASRGGFYPGGGGIIPLAIPWGITKDIDRNNYSVDLFQKDPSENGFEANTQYILKLGGGNLDATTTVPLIKLLLVPMDNNSSNRDSYSDGQPNDTAYLKAYGLAYWCLRIVKVNGGDDSGDKGYWFPDLPGVKPNETLPGHEGIEWLLGFKGGAFLLPYDDGAKNRHFYPKIRAKLDALGIRYDVIQGFDNSALSIPTLYKNVSQAKATVLKIDRPRPRVAVYSSQSDPDAVESALRDAQIPYGSHPQTRSGAFNANLCNHIYDSDILNGELQRATAAGEPVYTWLHTHHEDFTGFNGGCDRLDRSCYDWDDGSYFGSNISPISKSSSTTTELCSYCRDYYFSPPAAGWGIELDQTQCYRLRKMKTNCREYTMSYTNDGIVSNGEICPICLPWYSANTWAGTYPKKVGNKTYPNSYASCWINQKTYSCQEWDAVQPLQMTASTSTALCPYCRGFYFYDGSKTWDSPKKKIGYDQAQCKNWGLRCGDKIMADGTFWHDLASYSTKMCRGMSDAYPQCRDAKASWDLATTLHFTDDAGYKMFPPKLLDSTGLAIISKDDSRPLPADSDVILHPNRVQKMKWKLSELILKHVQDGGYFYSQCFAPETLGIALWQRKIWLDQLKDVAATANGAYADVMGFQNFTYFAYPWGYYKNGSRSSDSPTYSTINGNDQGTFPLTDPFDARCQDHGNSPSGGTGYTDCFYKPTMKTTIGSETIVILGSVDATHPEYFKGEKPGNAATPGQFCFMGGHSLSGVEEERLVLDNVLLGALAEKIAGTAVTTKQKGNYGIIDPDNTQGGGADDYRDFLINGYNSPITLDSRITPEPGNKVGPTNQGVAQRVASGGQLVIVPITDIGPEVWVNSKQNNGAETIYDLQGQDNLAGNHLYDPDAADAGKFQSVVRVIGFAEFLIVPSGNAFASNTQAIGDYQSGQVRGVFVRYIVKPYDDYTPLN